MDGLKNIQLRANNFFSDNILIIIIRSCLLLLICFAISETGGVNDGIFIFLAFAAFLVFMRMLGGFSSGDQLKTEPLLFGNTETEPEKVYKFEKPEPRKNKTYEEWLKHPDYHEPGQKQRVRGPRVRQGVTRVTPPFVPSVEWPKRLINFAKLDPSIKVYPGGTPYSTPYDFVEKLNSAYVEFNRKLFSNHLETCTVIIRPLLHKHSAVGMAHSHGRSECDDYIRTSTGSMVLRSGDTCRKIELDDKYIKNAIFQGVLATLVHEMCHVEQFAKAPDEHELHGPHWVKTMRSVGLIPTSTGAPGGKEIGDRITHYIEEGGVFDRVSRKVIAKWATLKTDDKLGVISNVEDKDYD